MTRGGLTERWAQNAGPWRYHSCREPVARMQNECPRFLSGGGQMSTLGSVPFGLNGWRIAALEQECVDLCQGTCATFVEHVEKRGDPEGRPEEGDRERRQARQTVGHRWGRGRMGTV